MRAHIDRFTSWSLMALLVVVSAISTTPGVQAEDLSPTDGVTALFEGEVINLAEGWGEAKACLIWQDVGVSECFRTEREMDLRIAELETQNLGNASAIGGGGVVTAGSTCSGYLRLYDRTWYGSPVLYLRDRFQWLNLSGYGFNQKTSSYKVGPCYSYFADYANGGGSWYPTYLTQAYDLSPSMISGWNNDVSSVYIG